MPVKLPVSKTATKMVDTVSTAEHPHIREALERIRPAVRADGGDIELVDVVGDTVRVRFKGACIGCPSSSLTLRWGIERTVRDAAPEIKTVIAVP